LLAGWHSLAQSAEGNGVFAAEIANSEIGQRLTAGLLIIARIAYGIIDATKVLIQRPLSFVAPLRRLLLSVT
jgi:hypothetical protein